MQLATCYYPEHWPEAQWATDAARMTELGLTYVRIGEFAWSRIEPTAGQYDWAWMDRAIGTLAAAGLKIILGTPTATPPKWLLDSYPGIYPCDAFGNRRTFGSRRHYSFSSPDYLRESERIVEAMAARYGKHPALAMWQTDNEYGCHDTVQSNDASAIAAFRVWLAAKYGDVTTLNTQWGNVFWSQEYQSFEQIDPPLATVTEGNPAHRLDWVRFASDEVVAYDAMQRAAISKHSDRPITHNFMGHFNQFDHYDVGAPLDIASWDSYPLGFLEMAWWPDAIKQRYAQTGHPDFAGFHHDLYRSVSGGRFGVMEQQPGPVNWATHNPAPLPGMVNLWTLEAYAHGAEFVSYFRWRQAPFAQEQMHAGLNRPDYAPAQAFAEAGAAKIVLDCLPDAAKSPPELADVALVYDYDASWMCETQPQGESFNYEKIVFEVYTALRRLGQSIDIVPPGRDLSAYKLVVVPSQPYLSLEFMNAIKASSAAFIFGPRTGSKTQNFSIPKGLAPGSLAELLPMKVLYSESLREDTSRETCQGSMHIWRDCVESAAESTLKFEDGFPALVTKDRFTYLAGWPEEELLAQILKEAVTRADLPLRILPEGLRIRQRGEHIFAMNYGYRVNLSALGLTSDETVFIAGGATLARAQYAIWRTSPPSQAG